jgi:nucleotide-binding universal stress UspA family protein
MIYATLMVHLELGEPNAALLRVARDIATRVGATVIGIAASQPLQAVFGGSYATGDVIQQDREEVETEVEVAEVEFRSEFQAYSEPIEWRSSVIFGSLCDYVAGEARSADLVITGVPASSLLGGSRCLNMSEFVMQVGRPVFIVPRSIKEAKLDRVVVAWKDTREARRAAYDALPILKMASHVSVVEIATDDGLADACLHVQDVVAWLKRHGIAAEAVTSGSTGDDAELLRFIAEGRNADVIVAGAYGHGRLREWMLGGVTKDLLLRAERCSLVSH